MTFHTILTALAGVMPLYLKYSMSFLWLTPPTIFTEESLFFLNVSIDIEDMQAPKIMIFFNNVVVFEE